MKGRERSPQRRGVRGERREKSKRSAKEIWLGGLDSNQDNQIQNLMYCRLYDLPAEGDKKSAEIAGTNSCLTSG
jgi:hypothetical protein